MNNYIDLRQHLVLSSSSQAHALVSEMLFRHSLVISKCLRLLEISSSSSSLELQIETPDESKGVSSFSFAKCISPMSKQVFGSSGPDLLAGVL